MSMTSPRLLKTVRKFPWQCIDCKMCEICQVKGNDVSGIQPGLEENRADADVHPHRTEPAHVL
jgi:hypothetical protein